MLYTTLTKIWQHSLCEDGWEVLLDHLGKTAADDEPLSLATIFESNGFDDALWCLRAVDDADYFMRRFALDCARSVEHLTADPRVKACNDTTERYLAGHATEDDLAAAKAAAIAAAWDAVKAAGAARAAENAAAKCAAWAAENAAAKCAAMAAAWAVSAWDAAGTAAWRALGAHFLACLHAWPNGEWPMPPKLTGG